ncbi:MAG: hypothetical protein ABSF54_05990 [Bryobacteraceae bacterium]|jgi:hypothetical protein
MPAGPDQSIDVARRCVRKALQQWNAADLKSVEASRKLLEESVTALKMAIDLLRNGDSTMTSGLQPAIASLRRDISTMIRLVDACSAFHRRTLLREVGALPPYDASGKTVGAPYVPPAGGVIG